LDIIKQEQHFDNELLPIINYLKDNILPDDDKLARKVVFQSSNHCYVDELLYHHNTGKNKANDELKLQLVIPKNLRLPILVAAHDNLSHRGIPAVFATIAASYFWTNMFKDVNDYVKSCVTCSEFRRKCINDRAPLQPIKTSNHAFQSYAIDIIGKLETTSHHNKYILIVIDTFTKYSELIPLKSIDAHTVAMALYDNIICRYGCFKTILSDQGTQFTSALFQNLIKVTGATHLGSTSYAHQSVGIAERNVQTLKNWIFKLTKDSHNRWDQYLNIVRFSYNITINDATKTSPHMLVHGRWPLLNIDTALCKSFLENKTTDQELEDLTNKIDTLEKITYENIQNAQRKMEQQYNKHSSPVKFVKGMRVWLYVYKLTNKYSHKGCVKYIGPFVITKCEGLNCYLSDLETGKDLRLPIHVNRLAPYYARNILPPVDIITPDMIETGTDAELTDMLDGEIPQTDVSEPIDLHHTNTDTDHDTNATKSEQTEHTRQHETTIHQPDINYKITNNFHDEKNECESESESESKDDKVNDTARLVRCATNEPRLNLPRPSAKELAKNTQRLIHEIKKAIIRGGTKFYFIIYKDDIKNGYFVKESNLTADEKIYIENNSDKIKMLRSKPKVLKDV
jgi:hypothetical protein